MHRDCQTRRADGVLRMSAVGIDIKQVVDDVGSRRGEREANEGDERVEQARGGYDVSQQQRQKDEQVLGPLVRANGIERRAEGAIAFFKGAGGCDALGTEARAEPAAGVGDHGIDSAGEQRQVGRVVADIVEIG